MIEIEIKIEKEMEIGMKILFRGRQTQLRQTCRQAYMGRQRWGGERERER